MSFVSEYKDLLIKQYWEKTKAPAEIELKAGVFERVIGWLDSILDEYDLDTATGHRLDVIGKIVGIKRRALFFPSVTDEEYRFFLKVKIAKNVGTAFLVSDDDVSIQDVILTAFDGDAYVVDNQNMTLTLYVAPSFDLSALERVIELDLLPKPQAVRYDVVIQAVPGENFGFANNPDAQGFDSKFDAAYEGGLLARKVIF